MENLNYNSSSNNSESYTGTNTFFGVFILLCFGGYVSFISLECIQEKWNQRKLKRERDLENDSIDDDESLPAYSKEEIN